MTGPHLAVVLTKEVALEGGGDARPAHDPPTPFGRRGG